jgi:hypothetical protein
VNQAVPANEIERVPTPESTTVAAKPPPQLSLAPIAAPEPISPGSVLFKSGTVFPPTLGLKLKPVGSWDLVRGHDGFAVDRKLRTAGWQLFFMVPALEASAIGVDTRKTFDTALRKITRAVDERGFNALEVTAIKRWRWLGLHYVRITAHPRHVRNSPFLRDLNPHHYPVGRWDFKRIFTVRNRQASQMKAM